MSTTETHDLLELRDAASGRAAGDVLQEMAAQTRSRDNFVVLAHANPDGDALGSQAALTLGLRQLGKRAQAFCAGSPPEKFLPLFPAGLLETADDPAVLPDADACFLLDAAEAQRAGPLEAYIRAETRMRLCMDHHPLSGPSGQTGAPAECFDGLLVVPESPSTANLVLAFLDSLGVTLTREIAQALWIGLATDTGWFRFANTTPRAMRAAARLVAYGLDTEALYRRIYGELPAARARVLGTVLSKIQVDLEGEFVWSALSRRDYSEEGLEISDLDGMIDFLKSVRGAGVAALIVEVENRRHKVSLRSVGDTDVRAVARRFGGGGHAKAAGYRADGTPEQIVEDLRAEVKALVAGAGPDASPARLPEL